MDPEKVDRKHATHRDDLPAWIPTKYRPLLLNTPPLPKGVPLADWTTNTKQLERMRLLAKHPRMQPIYRSLLSRKRKDHKSTNQPQYLGQHNRYKTQEDRVLAFITYASLADRVPFITRTAKNKMRKNRDNWRAKTEALVKNGTLPPAVLDVIQQVDGYNENLLTLPNARKGAQLRATCVMLIKVSNMLFGSPRYSSVATTLSVLRGIEISSSTVRQLAMYKPKPSR